MEEELKEAIQPTSLENCFELLDNVLTDRDLYKKYSEEKATAMAHPTLGRWIRNNWYLWWSPELAAEYKDQNYPQEKPLIVQYFNNTWELTHADDMSGIILLAYHRYLNEKELGIEEEVKKYKAHWDKYEKD